MEVTYYDWGGADNSDFDQFDKAVQEVHQACLDNPSCEIIELRADDRHQRQLIIVEIGDGSFEADNPAGIHRVERLALSFCATDKFCWDVRALRKDFPITLHQNHVLEGEPRSLCLYIEPWESVERSWTPQLFIKRIFWWLRATADGTIHGDDQPIEHLFFSSPFNILLPEKHFESEDSANKKLSFEPVSYEGIRTKTLIGKYCNNSKNFVPLYVSVSLLLNPVENSPIEEYPHTLGQLQDSLEKRGSDILGSLKSAIQDLASENGIESKKSNDEFVLLLLGIPRSINGNIEKIDTQGFIVDSEVASLGEKLSVLCRAPGQKKWYRDPLRQDRSDKWKSLLLFPVNVKCYPTSKEIRRYSGLNPDDDGPKGIIAGVGALGGLLAIIWERECWGKWSYVDDDIIQAHNIVRHISTHHGLGHPKSVVVNSTVSNIHQTNKERTSHHFVTDILSDDAKLVDAINDSDLLIDATTTLHVPRAISRKDHYPRTASIFITPSGMASVMLLEDANRTVRCNSLEAQYYRAILNSEWGAKHLSGHFGRQWVGAGCREITLSMSDELVHLHSAILARQLRKNISQPEPKICIWDYQEDTGGAIPYDIPVFQTKSIQINGWEIIWDDGFIESAKKYRADALPNETGGILFGIIDQKDKTITLVKACFAPENSESTPSSFGRGAYSSTDILDECHERTAGIVTYVGEWHSHPPNFGALPSQDDIGQLYFLTSSLQIEGMPALMMIVAKSSVGFYLNKQGEILSLNK
ncbi:Mov34/MPN/PAD-1 family protein [uncultured Desulfosarcina sp.]|uniref:Mov34/MPN/PAD-1 family protein n=1 Tax=uncultured Desulfosarcina sp. TaxID=218289 RepID=UPI0029C66C76|nr:Mov34/MPN/PAD-1 family protein [uncultured Desulfosarcina sp.]